MKVFEYNYEIDYGGGIMLIAAESTEAADAIAQSESTRWGFWVYSGERNDLTYNGTAGIILSYTRSE